MEPRGPQRVDRKQSSANGPSAENKQTKTRMSDDYFKLKVASNSWLRISLSAKDHALKFTNLFCHISVENFCEAFRSLDGSKAVGIDGQTKLQYGKNLEANLRSLVDRLHKGTYRPQPKKRAFIAKADGSQRPLAISSFEDKLVEWVVAKLLSLIYEPLFIRNSFGFRPKRSTYEAIKATFLSLKDDKRPFVVEIDYKSFFDTVPHRKLILLLQKRIGDKRFLSLVSRFLQVEILTQNKVLETISDVGTPQGSIMSPVLANVYLHHALDEWFLKNYASRDAIIVRYADDAIFMFKDEDKAKDFAQALRARASAFGLTINEDKSGIVSMEKRSGKVFHFLGFTFYWGKDRGASKRRFKVKTQKTRLFKKIAAFTDWIKEQRARLTTKQIWKLTAAKLTGHYNYYGVMCNRPSLSQFYFEVTKSLFKWLNRRSQRKSYSWARFAAKLRHEPLPQPPPVAALKPLIDRSIYVH